ncbi:hypothetical protein Cs7R123_64540 [Catellatospora sp. TT07R-123]|uniref:hypothetical protein n=1 Tax=Catellatospora sp. TT07R-123 TaxID=2733863 RepID=UPI001B0AF019|nr:hypothetical protein [Catellatospora sp. TT07R-123]GHJ49112.1 hypothetical protein Cs7R123_64540 [Catellatospora sp. TT07R-123]
MSEQQRQPGLTGLALGAAVLVAERLRRLGGTDPEDQQRVQDLLTSGVEPALVDARSPLAVAVGLTQQGADLARQTGARLAATGRDRARRLLDDAASPRIAPLAAARDAVRSTRDRGRDVVATAGLRGRDTLLTGRAAAVRAFDSTVEETVSWLERTIVPRMVDNLVPHLIDRVVPRLVEGALPEIRHKVIPVVIDDLTRDPRLQALITEQSRGVLANAADELRTTSATADDRIEESFRRLFHVHHTNGDR